MNKQDYQLLKVYRAGMDSCKRLIYLGQELRDVLLAVDRLERINSNLHKMFHRERINRNLWQIVMSDMDKLFDAIVEIIKRWHSQHLLHFIQYRVQLSIYANMDFNPRLMPKHIAIAQEAWADYRVILRDKAIDKLEEKYAV